MVKRIQIVPLSKMEEIIKYFYNYIINLSEFHITKVYW